MEGQFRTALSGFRKNDVLDFIDRQEKEYKSREQELNSNLNELRKALDDEKSAKAELERKLAGLEDALMKGNARNQEAEEKIAVLSGEAENRRCVINRAEVIIEDLQHEIADLKQKQSQTAEELSRAKQESDQLRESMRTIGTTRERISRVMEEAQNTADGIVIEARRLAAETLRNAEKRMEQILEQAGGLHNGIDTLGENTAGLIDAAGEMARTISEAAAGYETPYRPAETEGIIEEGENQEEILFDWQSRE